MKEQKSKKGKKGNGEGCIRQRKDGKWEAIITTGYDDNGRQKRKFFYGKTRKEVADKLYEATGYQKQGLTVNDNKYTVSDWLDKWLWDYKRHNIKPRTFESYDSNINNYIKPAIGKIKLTDLNVDHVQGLIKCLYDRKLTRSITCVNTTLKSALKQAVKNGLIPRNVCECVSLPKQTPKKEVQVLTPEEQARLQEVIKEHELYPAFLLLLTTGVRLGELLALTWKTVDFKENSIKITKNIQRIHDYDEKTKKKLKSRLVIGTPKSEKSIRTIPMVDIMAPVLKSHKNNQGRKRLQMGTFYNNNDLVFATETGTPIEPRNFSRTFKKLLKKAEISTDINVHAMRHNYATRGLENGIDLKVLQELLGHSSVKITGDTYSHVLPDKKRESVKKLNGVFTIRNT